jgi:polyhydroxyalkanoate synthesis regulator phasin
VIAVGVAVGTIQLAGLRQLRREMNRGFKDAREYTDQRFHEWRDDIRELRRDVNHLREAVGTLRKDVGALRKDVSVLQERAGIKAV